MQEGVCESNDIRNKHIPAYKNKEKVLYFQPQLLINIIANKSSDNHKSSNHILFLRF